MNIELLSDIIMIGAPICALMALGIAIYAGRKAYGKGE